MIAKTGEELLEICEKYDIPLSEYAIRCEVEEKGLTREEVIDWLIERIILTASKIFSVSVLLSINSFSCKSASLPSEPQGPV